VTKQLSSLVNRQLAKKGVNQSLKIEFVKAIGDKTQTLFHYSINATKQYHHEIKATLNAVCKEKEVNRNNFRYKWNH